MQDAGYIVQFCHRAQMLESDRFGVAVVVRATDGRSFAAIYFGQEPTATKTAVNVIGRFAAESFETTTAATARFRPIPAHGYYHHLGRHGQSGT